MNRLLVIKYLLALLDRREKTQLTTLIVMMGIGAGLEMLGIGIILPFIVILSRPEIIEQNRVLSWAYRFLDMNSSRDFVFVMGCILLLVFIFKNAFLALLGYAQSKFALDKQTSLSKRLFNAYMRNPYTFHLQHNTASLLRNINSEVASLVNGVIVPMLSLLNEVLVVACILALLVAIEPYVALVTLGVAGGLIFFTQNSLKSVIGKYGRKRMMQGGEMNKWVNQGLGGIKESKILGREEFFILAHHKSSLEYAKSTLLFSVLNILPRLLIETLAVVAILLAVLVMLIRGSDPASTLPVLGIFAIAAIRLMPSTTRIFFALSSLRFYSPVIDVVKKGLDECGTTPVAGSIPLASSAPVSARNKVFSKAIELKGVWYKYPSSHNWSLRNVSLTLSRGSSVAFAGPSGAGKSTLVDLILGLLKPEQGSILVDGLDIFSALAAWQRTIGYVPQSIYLLDDTIRRNVAFGMADEEIDDARVWDVLRAAQLEAKVKALPDGLDSYVGERGVRLSGGERQRIGIARALYHDPEILVFDEATSALDHQTEREISETMGHLRARKTLITIAHRLSTVKNCDRMFFMNEGAVVDSGSYEDLINKNSEFRLMIGKELT